MFDFPRMIKENVVRVLVFAVVFALLGYTYTAMFKTPYYSADASVVIKAISGEDGNAQYNNYLVANGLTKSLSIIAESDVIASAVATAIGDNALNKDAISTRKHIRVIENSNVMIIETVHENADIAAKIANNYAEVISQIGPNYINNIEVIKLDEALVASSPAGPNKLIGAIAGVLLGLFMGLLVSYLKDFSKYRQI